MRFPATPGWGPPAVVVCGSPPILVVACRLRWGVSRVGCPLLCVFVVCVVARGGRAVLCVACLWCPRCWWCGVVVRWVCLPRALVCVVTCVWCAGGLWFVVPASFGWGLRLVFFCSMAPSYPGGASRVT